MIILRRLIAAFVVLFASLGLHAVPYVERPSHEGMGRQLRHTFLDNPAAKVHASANGNFLPVFGVAMDWPVRNGTVTVISASDGTASIYTTSAFFIIGGGFHPEARKAASRFVSLANRHIDEALPTSDYPYPAAGKVRFYLLTYYGVRVIEADLNAIEEGSSRFRRLFGAGQDVITELRLLVQKP